MTGSRQTVEFHRPLAAESVGPQLQIRHIEAEPTERDALALRFGLLSLDKLAARIELRRAAGQVIRANGHLTAEVVQRCVVSLAPVPARIEADFGLCYSTSAPMASEADIDILAPEEPEPLVGGEIDLGEAVAQQLAVSLDPYPRAPDASWPPADGPQAAAVEAAAPHPFAGLAALKKRGGERDT